MFSGAIPPADPPSGSVLVGSGTAPRVTPASRFKKAFAPRNMSKTLRYLRTGTRSLLRGAPDRVELPEKGARHPFHYLGLLGGQVLPPAAGLRLAVELALTLLLGRYVLPGV